MLNERERKGEWIQKSLEQSESEDRCYIVSLTLSVRELRFGAGCCWRDCRASMNDGWYKVACWATRWLERTPVCFASALLSLRNRSSTAGAAEPHDVTVRETGSEATVDVIGEARESRLTGL